ncbi:MAG: radical SAM protein [Desulfovibrio aminophilus]|uniref:B12-binding domain-containing radical SAM protein n=1 Tax=Desulfovibrio aminophilus TaxID=81425 RepID=UPI0039E99B3E
MNVTFIFPDWVDPEATIEHDKQGHGIGHLSFAVATLSAVLKQSGHDVNLLHICYTPKETSFKDMLREQCGKTDLFAFSFTEVEKFWVRDMARWIHEETGRPCIGGGIYPTLEPEKTLRMLGLDMACIGEGEDAMLEVCARMEQGRDAEGVENIWFLRGEELVKNPTGRFVEDLDTLPPFDYDLFDPSRLKIFVSNLPRLYYLCTRNCVFGCAFCANHAKRQAMKCGSKYVRRFSPERVISDLKLYLSKFPQVRLIHFADEVIHQDKEWFGRLMKLYREEIALPWRSYAMVKVLDEEVIGIMARSHCARVNLGIEAGSARVRKLYNRPEVTEEEIIGKIKLLKRHGIDVHTSTLLNAPTETLDEMIETIKLVARADTDIAVTGIVVPYDGTRLRRMAEEMNLYDELAVENTGVSIRPVDCTPNKVLFLYHAYRLLVEVYKYLYKRPGLSRFLMPVVDAVVKSPLLPHTLLIAIRKRFFEGRILNWAYRKAETRLGREERNLKTAINEVVDLDHQVALPPGREQVVRRMGHAADPR